MHAITDGAVVAVCGLRRREIVLAYRAFSGGHPQRARHPSAYDVAHHRPHSIDQAGGPADALDESERRG
jgi:hypothetical protein